MKLKQIILWNILLLFLLSPCFSKEKDAILEIKWNKITPYEYLGYIEEDCYILDLYEDFIEAKIKEDESKYDFYKIENNYIYNLLNNIECTLAIISKIDSDFSVKEKYYIYLKDKELYKTKNLIQED